MPVPGPSKITPSINSASPSASPPASQHTRLAREVVSPQKTSNGLGVMIVAGTAMFFAVASSAFILRARMACPTRIIKSPVVIDVTARAPANPPHAVNCGAATVQAEGDGSLIYTFVPCPTWSIDLIADPSSSAPTNGKLAETGTQTVPPPTAIEGVLVNSVDAAGCGRQQEQELKH